MRPTEGHPIYLLHGLLATSYAHFGEQIHRWADSFRVVPIDLPGHGRSRHEAKRPFYESCQALLLRYTAAYGPGHVVGASYLGGTVALRTALAAPERFRSIVLTGYVPEAPHGVVTRWTDSFFTVAEKNPALAAHYDHLHGPRWRRTLAVVAEEIREAYPTAVAVPKEKLALLRVPALLLNGSRKSDERAAVAAVPSASPLIDAGLIPRAGHIPSYEQPTLFALHLEQFWAALEHREPGRPAGLKEIQEQRPLVEEVDA